MSSRRNNKAVSQAETADLASALSEAASNGSSSAAIHATRGASSAALLAKDSASHGSQPVATSAGLGFCSFSPISSQSVPNACSSVFLTEDDVPPSNQLGAQQLVIPEYTTSLVQPVGLRLSGVGVTAVLIADRDGIFPSSHVKTILPCEPRRSRFHGGVGSVATRR